MVSLTGDSEYSQLGGQVGVWEDLRKWREPQYSGEASQSPSDHSTSGPYLGGQHGHLIPCQPGHLIPCPPGHLIP